MPDKMIADKVELFDIAFIVMNDSLAEFRPLYTKEAYAKTTPTVEALRERLATLDLGCSDRPRSRGDGPRGGT